MIKAVIFDLDGTLYNFKGLPFRLVKALPLDFFLIKADRQIRRGFKGCDFGSSQAYKIEYGKQMSHHCRFNPEDALNWSRASPSGSLGSSVNNKNGQQAS